MKKTILITGSTDGIGLETAKLLARKGHNILIHGRNKTKLNKAYEHLIPLTTSEKLKAYQADLSNMPNVMQLAKTITDNHSTIDVLINNAGIYTTPSPQTDQGLDVRFAVNTLAPYLLTKQIAPLMPETGRVLNLSSAAQAPVVLDALRGSIKIDNANQAYAQSKLAITMWSFYLAQEHPSNWPSIIAINPGSLLASKMVKNAYGIEGKSLSIGAKVLVKAAVDKDFANASGTYFDNDSNTFSAPHNDALNSEKNKALVQTIETLLKKLV
ncbi:SDR family NAD(P)-dependent oxidoreductase [Neptuniibacter marinus]|jgi:NAD(P)-dependent dehydrogenase (short-subunit alcohol dehydrogenase family)|uniref:SDR family NAD(P)-dependent oxidoreductase n=1 Tax=Neptuniibacter marinus TaxID=1806670 RepID=UPI0008368B0E|nr:SDR family NAD(P)-dependent oxidoreductase [Neptuniibacter marinus]